jgi:hypothetical protein
VTGRGSGNDFGLNRSMGHVDLPMLAIQDILGPVTEKP